MDINESLTANAEETTAAEVESAEVGMAAVENAAKDDAANELKNELGALRGELERMRTELSAFGRAAAARDAGAVSAGKVSGVTETLFSPAEVRSMSRSEVRDNLDRIRESMRHW